jgi:hypothetical protein
MSVKQGSGVTSNEITGIDFGHIFCEPRLKAVGELDRTRNLSGNFEKVSQKASSRRDSSNWPVVECSDTTGSPIDKNNTNPRGIAGALTRIPL